MKFKYTQFFDISTDTTGFQVFSINAGGKSAKVRCLPYFGLFKHYKLGKIRVKLVPSSTLPVDPTGLSYSAGDTTVDPRDMFNPGLVRITNGEQVGNFVSGDDGMNQYYATMLDSRWYKFRLQSGFSRTAKPLVYNIAVPTPVPDHEARNILTTAETVDSEGVSVSSMVSMDNDTNLSPGTSAYTKGKKALIIQTGKVKLGWMPTNDLDYDGQTPVYSNVPEVPLITFILPKAYKTKFYYRVFVEEELYFKDPIAVNPLMTYSQGTRKMFKPVDSFVYIEPEKAQSYVSKSTGLSVGEQEGR